jgi:hypothetical protein
MVEKVGEVAILAAIESDKKLPERSVQEQALRILFKISQRNDWELHRKLIPLLNMHASYCLSENEFAKARELYAIVLSAQPDKAARMAQAFLLARNEMLDEAILLLDDALKRPIDSLDRGEFTRLCFVLKECMRRNKPDAAAKIVDFLLPRDISTAVQMLTERVGGLVYDLVSQGDLETAEYLLDCAKQKCENNEHLLFELLVPYLLVPSRYNTFVNLLWQPKADKEAVYHLLLELKRRVEARHRANYLRPYSQ